jgi:NADPH:quinone reductase
MRCVLIDNPGPQSRLIFSEVEIPSCDQEQLLVRVKATALNRADLLQRQGNYSPPVGESAIPGLEIAGEVVGIGKKVKRFKIADRVYGLVASGGYAEYCCIHQDLAAKIPEAWDFTYAAAIPEALLTAYATVFTLGQLKQGQTLLIHAAGSGVSCFAIQMANQIGAKVITTASNQEKIDKAKQLGPTTIINYKKEDFAAVIAESSVDLIVDFIGGDYFPKHLRLLKPQGKLVQIACMQGRNVDCDLAVIMRKRLQIIGFVLRPQTIAEKAALWKAVQQQWFNALLNKALHPVIDSEFELADINQAHLHMQASAHFGKIVLLL